MRRCERKERGPKDHMKIESEREFAESSFEEKNASNAPTGGNVFVHSKVGQFRLPPLTEITLDKTWIDDHDVKSRHNKPRSGSFTSVLLPLFLNASFLMLWRALLTPKISY